MTDTTITWTKCSEALPPDEETVLIAMDDGEVWMGFVHGGDWSTVGAWPLADVSVTHWAHMPKHPEDV